MTQGDSVISLVGSRGPQDCSQKPSDTCHPGTGAGLLAVKNGFTLFIKDYQFIHNKLV